MSLSATFVRSPSAWMRSSSSRYAVTTARVSASSRTPSPRIAVLVRSPLWFSLRSTGTASSSVSPATNRAAPSRKPYFCTSRCRRGLSAAARITLRSTLKAPRRRRSARPRPARRRSARGAGRAPPARRARRGSRAPPSTPRGTGGAAATRAGSSPSPPPPALGSETSGTTASGKLAASPETAPAAPAASARSSSASAPTNTSSPSRRYGSTRSQGLSETFIPARFGARSRSRSITGSGIA